MQALMTAIEATPPLPASEAPKFGEFYTTQHGESWPPLPGDILHLPFWDLGSGFYLLDDTNVDYAELAAEAEAAGSFRRFGADFEPLVITTNDLALIMDGWTNADAYLTIHPAYGAPTNATYDLWFCTNLAQPIDWQWVLRSQPGQTNLVVSNSTSPQAFYRLASHTDSLGTNFWLAFGKMYSDGSNAPVSVYYQPGRRDGDGDGCQMCSTARCWWSRIVAMPPSMGHTY